MLLWRFIGPHIDCLSQKTRCQKSHDTDHLSNSGAWMQLLYGKIYLLQYIKFPRNTAEKAEQFENIMIFLPPQEYTKKLLRISHLCDFASFRLQNKKVTDLFKKKLKQVTQASSSTNLFLEAWKASLKSDLGFTGTGGTDYRISDFEGMWAVIEKCFQIFQ